MKAVIFPYKMGSASSRLLASTLGALRVYPDGNYRPRADDIIINWGNSRNPSWLDRAVSIGARLFNSPESVARASNKLTTFQVLSQAGVSVPRWTTDRNEARRFNRVAVRHVLNGHSGRGLEVVESDGEIPEAPLYTEMVNNDGEYRVHVFNGRVIDYTKKRRENGDEPLPEQLAVRNLATGWIYARQDLRRLERVEQLALNAVNALGLNFGAVDIIKNGRGDVFVLEVNTAVGLAPTTLENYTEVIRSLSTVTPQ